MLDGIERSQELWNFSFSKSIASFSEKVQSDLVQDTCFTVHTHTYLYSRKCGIIRLSSWRKKKCLARTAAFILVVFIPPNIFATVAVLKWRTFHFAFILWRRTLFCQRIFKCCSFIKCYSYVKFLHVEVLFILEQLLYYNPILCTIHLFVFVFVFFCFFFFVPGNMAGLLRATVVLHDTRFC